MKNFRFVIILLFLIFVINVTNVGAREYPNKTGYVNDFAGILSKSDIQKLDQELKEYNIRTSNEVVVVTINSLEDVDIEEYTLGLANYWRVGKAGKDNGVVFLVAPNDGEMRIEVGKGLENILTQTITDNIRDNDIIPYFKQNEMSEGIFSGARSIMRNIDQQSVAKVSQTGVSTPQPVITNPDGRTAKIISYILILIFIGMIVLIPSYWMMKRSKMKKENMRLLEMLENDQLELSGGYNNAKIKLELLKKNNPLSIWEELEKEFNDIVFENIDQKLNNIRTNSNMDDTRNMIKDLDKEIRKDINIYKKISERIEDVEKAKRESIQYFKDLPKLIKDTENIVNHPDVFLKTKTLFDEEIIDFKKVDKIIQEDSIDSVSVNWLEIYSNLKSIKSDLNDVQRKAESDKAMANRAREEGPKLLMDMPNLIEETEKEIGPGNMAESITSVKNQYRDLSNSPQDIDTFLKLIVIKESLDDIREKNRKLAEEKEKNRRINEERRRRSSYSTSNSGGSFSGHGSGGSYSGGGGGGSFSGHGSSGKWK